MGNLMIHCLKFCCSFFFFKNMCHLHQKCSLSKFSITCISVISFENLESLKSSGSVPWTVIKKIGCTAANPWLLCGKPLCYRTIGLLNQNIYLRSKINVVLAKGNSIVALRREADAMTLLPNVERFHSC